MGQNTLTFINNSMFIAVLLNHIKFFKKEGIQDTGYKRRQKPF